MFCYASRMPAFAIIVWAGVETRRQTAAIASARVGDQVILFNDGRHWLIKDTKGRTLARMSRAFSPPADLTFQRGEVGAVVRWRKADSTGEYQNLIKREEWEAVLPELIFG